MPTLTRDDLAEMEAVQEQLEQAEQAVRDLADRCRRKGDVIRAGILKTGAAWKIERARQLVDEAYS